MINYNEFGERYQELAKQIYEGIYFAHPNISEELANDYARIAFYMIGKNKIEMSIHAPKKSYKKFKEALLELKRNTNKENLNDVEINILRKKYKK